MGQCSVDGAALKLSNGMSSGRSVALQPNNGFLSRFLLQICRLVAYFVPQNRPLASQTCTLESSSSCAPSFLFRSVLDPSRSGLF